MNKPRKQPTMHDVARLAGVTTMTVSRALRPNTSVSSNTRTKIQKAADELGYVLDGTASVFSSGKSGFVGVIIPSINNANFADTLRGLNEGFKDQRLQTLLGATGYSLSEEERVVQQFLQRRPEAIVLTGGSHSERCRKLITNSGIPVIEMWDLPKQPIGKVVGFSNKKAAKLMVQHLYDQGYRRIGFIGGDTTSDMRGLDRRIGFIEALKEVGLSPDRMVAAGEPPVEMGQARGAVTQMLQKWPDTDAIMCVSDPLAFAAMSECQSRGMSVPDDIAICGFGAYDISEHALPSISTVDVRSKEIGLQVAKKILQMLDPESKDSENQTIVEPKLIVRNSTLNSNDARP